MDGGKPDRRGQAAGRDAISLRDLPDCVEQRYGRKGTVPSLLRERKECPYLAVKCFFPAHC